MPEPDLRRRRPLALTAVVAVLGLLLAACGSTPQKFTGTRLDNPYTAPDVELTDTAGAPYSLAKDTTKPLTVVFFGYTHCADYCPLVMNNLSAALNRLDDADRAEVDVVFVTTDPARDDEKTLRKYLDGYGKDFIGLTGPLDSIIEVGTPLHVYVNDGVKLPTGGYDLGGHSTFTLGMRGDHAVALWSQETSSTEFASDFHALLNDD